MYKHWLVYTEKGEFERFKVLGSNDITDIEFFKDMFKDVFVFIDVAKGNELIIENKKEKIDDIKIISLAEEKFLREIKQEQSSNFSEN